MVDDREKGDGLGRERDGRLHRHVSNLLFLGHGGLAYLLHSFIFWLQHSPLAAMLGSASRPHLPKRTYECSVCGALYSFNGYTFVLAVGATRSGAGQRACPAIALPNDFWKHATWIDRTEKNHD